MATATVLSAPRTLPDETPEEVRYHKQCDLLSMIGSDIDGAQAIVEFLMCAGTPSEGDVERVLSGVHSILSVAAIKIAEAERVNLERPVQCPDCLERKMAAMVPGGAGGFRGANA